jgi:hypothetical protein
MLLCGQTTTGWNPDQAAGSHPNRLLKNKHRAVSQDAWRFGMRRISASIYYSHATPDHGLSRRFSTTC